MAVIGDFPVPEATRRGWPTELINWFVRLRSILFNVSNGDVVLENGDRAVITDSDGTLAESDVTSTELDYLDGATSNIQVQINTLTATKVDKWSIQAKSTTYLIADAYELVTANATGGAFTVTLPTAAGVTGEAVGVKKTDSTANVVTIDADGTETIDGELTALLEAEGEMFELVSNGTNWIVV